MDVVYTHCAGIDVHKKTVAVAIIVARNDGSLHREVRTFGTMTADLLEHTGMHPEELVDGVSSPGGTTIAAVEALEDGGFRAAINAVVSAAVRRAKEIGL